MSLSKEAASFGLAFSEWALLVFALTVVIGLVGEHKLNWWDVKYKTFEILVAVGCAGEVLADGGIFLFSSRLETLSRIEIAQLNKEAGDARKQAGEAIERASKADEQAGIARRDAGFASERASKNERDAAIARESAEKEKMERLQIQALVSARSIPPQALEELAPTLSKFKGKTVTLDSYANDPESFGLTRSIVSLLQSIPIAVQDRSGRSLGVGEAQIGLRITGPKSEEEFVQTLADGLSRAGRLLTTSSSSAATGTPVAIFVGIKPPFRFGPQ